MVHNLKTWSEYFTAVVKNQKTFEIRLNDRDYKVGDILNLQEYDPETEQYTRRDVAVKVTYILNKQPFVPEGYVAMGIKKIGRIVNGRIIE